MLFRSVTGRDENQKTLLEVFRYHNKQMEEKRNIEFANETIISREYQNHQWKESIKDCHAKSEYDSNRYELFYRVGVFSTESKNVKALGQDISSQIQEATKFSEFIYNKLPSYSIEFNKNLKNIEKNTLNFMKSFLEIFFLCEYVKINAILNHYYGERLLKDIRICALNIKENIKRRGNITDFDIDRIKGKIGREKEI